MSRHECHWCGGTRAPLRARALYILERWLRRTAGRVRNWHDCCNLCNGQGRR